MLGVGAASKTIDDEDNRNDRPITDFSSRGRSDVADRYYDRDALLANLREFHAIQEGATYMVDSETLSGTVGPAVNTGPGTEAVDEDAGSSTHLVEPFPNTDVVDLTLSLEPEGQWVRLRVHERRDGEWVEIAQMREEPLKQHDTLTIDVNGGDEYLVDLDPEVSVLASYTVEYEQFEKADGDLRAARPVTLYRPGISAHGDSVLSTQDKYDVLRPLGETGDAEPFYGRLSGTSMSCPAAAGVAMLVRQAYREECNGVDLDPIDVIRVVEHTAAAHNPSYTVANTGSGFVDAEAAVRTAAELAETDLTVDDLDRGLDVLVDAPESYEPPTDLEVTGHRESGRVAATGRQSMRVRVTVEDVNEAAGAVEVYDEIPERWTLLAAHSDARELETTDGRTRIRLVRDEGETVDASEVEGDAEVTFTYFVEAPEEPDDTDRYSFGPAEAVVATWALEADERGDAASEFGGTDDVLVAGVEL